MNLAQTYFAMAKSSGAYIQCVFADISVVLTPSSKRRRVQALEPDAQTPDVMAEAHRIALLMRTECPTTTEPGTSREIAGKKRPASSMEQIQVPEAVVGRSSRVAEALQAFEQRKREMHASRSEVAAQPVHAVHDIQDDLETAEAEEEIDEALDEIDEEEDLDDADEVDYDDIVGYEDSVNEKAEDQDNLCREDVVTVEKEEDDEGEGEDCLLYTSPSPRDS